DFDLAGTAGYAVARRPLSLDLPANYEIVFYLRGDAPVNNFQVKLVDASGENVWWVNRPDFEFSHDWQLVRLKKRHVAFGGGPTQAPRLRARGAVLPSCPRGSGRRTRVLVREQARRARPARHGGGPDAARRASVIVPTGRRGRARNRRLRRDRVEERSGRGP